MKCPSCKSSSLDWLNLEPDLPARGCSSCEGAWIARISYDAWRAKQPGDAPAKPAHAEIDVTDVRHAKLCPQCSQLMQKYHVSHDLAFYLDYCPSCGGIWLDRNEWAALRAQNLHDNLHQMVSKQWQADIQRQSVKNTVEDMFRQRLGDAAYRKTTEFRTWLANHDKKSLILAYLSDLDPA